MNRAATAIMKASVLAALLLCVLGMLCADAKAFGSVAVTGVSAKTWVEHGDAYVLRLAPTAWYAARKESYSDTDSVPTFNDQSGNGNDATQGSATLQPTFDVDGLGGRPALVFDGSDYLQSAGWTNALPNTVLVVGNITNAEDDVTFIFDSANSSGRSSIMSVAADSPDSIGIYAGGTQSGGVFPKTSDFLLACLFKLSGSEIFLGGQSVSTSGGSGTQNMIGATIAADRLGNNGAIGVFTEILIFNRTLTTAQRQALEDALGAVYGVTITH